MRMPRIRKTSKFTKLCALTLALVSIFYLRARTRHVLGAFGRSHVSQHIPVEGALHMCGYNFAAFADAVFPERSRVSWISGKTRASATDILLASLPCDSDVVSSYPGVVLFVDGENGRAKQYQHERLFYAGVQTPPCKVRGNIQLFHVAHTTLMHRYSAVDFLQPVRRSSLAPKFLAYLNSNCVKYRETAFDKIVEFANRLGLPKPTALGACHGSHPELSEFDDDRVGRIANVVDKLSLYRFALVMENSKVRGYVTEKIANALIAGTVPIYYGTEEISDIFNAKRFIYYDIRDPSAALRRIQLLERDRAAFFNVLQEPVLAHEEQTLRKYFSLTDDVGHGDLKRRIRHMIGMNQQKKQ
jgi:hypothetical protein